MPSGMTRFHAGSAWLLYAVTAASLQSHVMEGELRLVVRDPSGRPVPASVALAGQSPAFRAAATADDSGRVHLLRLPTGVYALSIAHEGFAPHSTTVEIRSAVPQERTVTLLIGALPTTINVESVAPLLDRNQPAQMLRAGRAHLDEILGNTTGRSVVDVVTTMPGWLLEANAVLHPRGSEYDTQYVVDGMPLYDNRSIGFAPAFEAGEFEAVNIMTAGIPAEYGRRLGGVIALDSRRMSAPGQSTEAEISGGSYRTAFGSIMHGWQWNRTTIALGMLGGRTDRYLDPPSIENFTNNASSSGYFGRLDRDLTDRDRISMYLRSNRTGFLVPNDLAQQAAGQRQDRRTAESAGRIHYQHTFSSRSASSIHAMVRDLGARLWSNPASTPVYVDQDRGFREGAVTGSFTLEAEHHTFKSGGDYRLNSVRESFRFGEPDELPDLKLAFADQARSTETSVYVQDHLRWGNFAASVGARFDHYRLLIRDSAFSPRLAVSYFVPGANLLVRAAYDRVFQPPPIENLLLSSAAARLDLDEVEGVLAVPASRADFFEVGLRNAIGNHIRIDVSHYWRRFRNYLDDDVFLNTGLSFPITFASARVRGSEIRLEMPRWHRVSSYVSYSNMIGTATSPVTGGLFVEGGEADELRSAARSFPISQDQRNTVAAQVRFEPHRRIWFTTAIRYGSGLPVELEDDDDEEDEDEDQVEEQSISRSILDRVNLDRGRIRPNSSLDFSAGLQLVERKARNVWVQVHVRNATDRLNVINFSGLFSGTALAPGRQVSLGLRVRL